jgi:hypothetical protein
MTSRNLAVSGASGPNAPVLSETAAPSVRGLSGRSLRLRKLRIVRRP